VISESTSYPGTLRSIVAKQLRNFDIDSKEIFLSVAPERINPGDQTPFSKIPRVIGAMSSHALKLTEQFYESLGCETFCASSPEVAEMSKLIENTFRQINISFINDLQELAYRSGINLRESIVAASTKPYGFMPFYPSAGIGGHCIPVDPHYLNFFAEQFNMKLNLITESTLINENMGKRIVNRIENEIKGEVKNRNILLLGITYKPNIADTRETSAIKIYEELRLRGANVSWHDSIVDEWNATKSSSIAETSWDVCLLISPHDTLDIDLILKHSRFVLDTSGKFSHNPRIIQI
jgi:UDP-N-acetyl-D-glucosamine dehydrogenase